MEKEREPPVRLVYCSRISKCYIPRMIREIEEHD